MEVQVKHLGAMQFEVSTRGHSVISDQPVEAGGHDEGMTPPEFFLAALGSCAGFYAAAYLRKKGLATEGTHVRVTAEKAGPPARLDCFRIEVTVPIELSEANRAGVDDAVHRCLIHNTMLATPAIRVEVMSPVQNESLTSLPEPQSNRAQPGSSKQESPAECPCHRLDSQPAPPATEAHQKQPWPAPAATIEWSSAAAG
jgi:putative redox protein